MCYLTPIYCPMKLTLRPGRLPILRSFLLVFLIACGSYAAHAQYWMQSAGGITVDEGYDIAVDGNGNSYTTGYFTGTMNVGAGSLNASGSTDIFVTKTNNQGVFQWAVKAGGSGADRGLSIDADAQGNCYVSGFFNGTATFGTQTIVSSGAQDVFVAKYNTSGVLQWVFSAGGAQADIGNGVSVDNSGNVYVTGEFLGTATFGTSTLASQANSIDVFTMKLDGNGNFTWVELGTGSQTNRGIDVATDNSGNVYVIGQFSDTITFDVQHPNTGFNAIFVIKYNTSGQEQWFRRISGGASNFGTAIEASGNGTVYLTGDFTGTLTFFGSTNNTLTNPYTNKVFVASYATGGNFSWAEAAGSDGLLNSRAIAIDGSGNVAIGGEFTCKLNEFADVYGQGTFNAVGERDIYIARYNASGAFQYARNLGGRQEDFAFGVALTNNGRVHYTGSYTDDLFVPTSSAFLTSNTGLWTQLDCSTNAGYCGDNNYGTFHGMSAAGNLDVVIANSFDPNREPFDFYLRSGTACARPMGDVCVGNNCPDTIKTCGATPISAFTNLCSGVGPNVSYSWNAGGGNQSSATFGTSGIKAVTINTADGCFTFTDSTFLQINPPPSSPTITDDAGFNLNASSPIKIELCDPDTVLITAGNLGGNPIQWSGPGLPANYTNPSFSTSQTGTYILTLFGQDSCQLNTDVDVEVILGLDSVSYEMSHPDSVELCANQNLQVYIYDAVVNPFGAALCLQDVMTNWTVTPNTPVLTNCETFALINPSQPGWYVFEAEIIRNNICESDTMIVIDSVYVDTLPSPVVPPFNISIAGPNVLCPGGSATFVASGGPDYLWTGPGVNNLTSDTVITNQDGSFIVTSTVRDTNSVGCTAQYTATAVKILTTKAQPQITASTDVICPNDTVAITVSSGAGGGSTFVWNGPGGFVGGDTITVLATNPGSYSVTVDDADSCGLVSNTLQLNQYATPSLAANNTFICPGGTVTISVVSSDTSLVEWQAPLSGMGASRTVTAPGTYTAKITVCGIETFADIVVLPAGALATITPSGPLCTGDSITLSAPSGLLSYVWSTSPGDTSSSITITQSGTYSITASDSQNCVASDTITVVESAVSPSISASGALTVCQGDSVMLLGDTGLTIYSWQPNGDSTQNITVSSPGTYFYLGTDSNGCSGVSNQVTVLVPDTIAPIDTLGNVAFCEGQSVTLTGTAPGQAVFAWSPGNDSTQSLVVTQSGTYTLTTIDPFGCVATSASVSVLVQPNNLVQPNANDTLICLGSQAVLTADTGAGNLVWYDLNGNQVGSGPVFTPPLLTATTIFYVQAEEGLCASDSNQVVVQVEDCNQVIIPNVITPNGDGVNDLFEVRIFENTCFTCKIYNRWGEMIYAFDEAGIGWDGTTNGREVSEGTYFFILEYCAFDGSKSSEAGYLTVIR